MDLVRVERSGATGTLVIDNPPVNAIAQPVRDELRQRLEDLEQDPAIRVVLLTGAGDRAFVAGADITEFPALRYDSAMERGTRVRPWWDYIAAYPKPLLAAINGHALGGGLELALCCDIRVAVPKARFGLPEAGLGIMPGGGGTQRLARLVGPGRAKLMILAGDQLTAAEAERYGLVEKVVEPEQLYTECAAIADRIATRAPRSVELAKQAINRGLQGSMTEGLAFEYECFARLMDTHDKNEGVAAFLEKRTPNWQGR
ncbi:MAG: enoyl-CoA hydratase/isomerase family protein [Chloroflexi bacterium]|nr:enoyl-CoA hydratase/isomerase family protein [Chloroflexota bacterium]